MRQVFDRYTEVNIINSYGESMLFTSRRKDVSKVYDPSFQSGFHIEFEIGGDDSTGVDATVDIYNLSEETINKIDGGSYLIVKSGYVNDYGTIFWGKVNSVVTERDGADLRVSITGNSLHELIRNIKLTVDDSSFTSYDLNTILEEVCDMAGISLLRAPNFAKFWEGSIAFEGTLAEFLDTLVALASDEEHTYQWSLQDGQLFVYEVIIDEKGNLRAAEVHYVTVSDIYEQTINKMAKVRTDRNDYTFYTDLQLRFPLVWSVRNNTIVRYEKEDAMRYYLVRDYSFKSNKDEHSTTVHASELFEIPKDEKVIEYEVITQREVTYDVDNLEEEVEIESWY